MHELSVHHHAQPDCESLFTIAKAYAQSSVTCTQRHSDNCRHAVWHALNDTVITAAVPFLVSYTRQHKPIYTSQKRDDWSSDKTKQSQCIRVSSSTIFMISSTVESRFIPLPSSTYTSTSDDITASAPSVMPRPLLLHNHWRVENF